MATYEERQVKALNQIAETLTKLDDTLGKMEDTDSKLKHFFEQEKAIHEIKRVIRKCKKIENLEQEKITDFVLTVDDIVDMENENLKDVANTFIKLDDTLAKLDEDKDSKVKSYLLQKKAIHETKKILNDLGVYDDFDDVEIKITDD